MTDSISIVIADDHTLVREGTQELLAKYADIDVVATVADGEAAVDQIARHRPDVALVDISMPGMNGIEVTRAVKADFPGVAILILTVHDEPGYIRALIEAGVAGYLLKSVSETELVRAIRAVHAGESVLHPVATRTIFESITAETGDFDDRSPGPLTDRELEVLRLAAQGHSNREIANRVDLSPRTVQTHLGNIFEKLEVASRTEAVIHALRRGWLDLGELE